MKDPLSAEGLDRTTDVTNYNYGQLKDATDDTSQDGTVIDKNLLADIRTVFMRAVRLTGIPINNQFDTENASQLFDACFGTEKVSITTFYNGVTAGTGGLRVWKTLGGKELRIEGWLSGGTTITAGMDLFLLPVGYRPTKEVFMSAMHGDVNITSGNVSYDTNTFRVKMWSTFGGVTELSNYINASIPLD